MDSLRIALVGGAALLVAGCFGTTPEEARYEELGFDGEGNEQHNPGKPCLACHGVEYAPGGDVFAVAGTIYMFADDELGLAGATVEITDARGRTFEAVTNRAGNFMVEGEHGVEGGSDVRVQDRGEGRVSLDFWPVFPLSARVTSGDLEQEMVTSIHREGSCSACHFQDPGADSVGRVYLMER